LSATWESPSASILLRHTVATCVTRHRHHRDLQRFLGLEIYAETTAATLLRKFDG
jgi:hypothetical protein